MTLRSRKKSERDLARVKPLISKKQQGIPALERINNKIYTEVLEKAVLPVVPPIKIKFYRPHSFLMNR